MSNNREERIYKDSVHLFLALYRTGTAKDKKCIRHVIKYNEIDELRILEAKLKAVGGEWRIHRTVNARNVEKARKILLKRLIDHPEKASYVDSEWRTALLDRECKVTNYFMLDVDKNDRDSIAKAHTVIGESNGHIIESHMSPNGIHIITEPFDTRKICELGYVTLLRDGYYFIKVIKENTK
jgi:hypothetical protein